LKQRNAAADNSHGTIVGAVRILSTLAVPEENRVVMYVADERTLTQHGHGHLLSLLGGLGKEQVEAGARSDYHCRFADSDEVVPVQKMSAEKQFWTMRVWSCASKRSIGTACVDFDFLDNSSATVLGTLRACPPTASGLNLLNSTRFSNDKAAAKTPQNQRSILEETLTGTSRQRHRLAMCIKTMYSPKLAYDDSEPDPLMLVPPYLQYHLHHGVGHFLFYYAWDNSSTADLDRLRKFLNPFSDKVTLILVPTSIGNPVDLANSFFCNGLCVATPTSS
jgi:hypothetical protein